MTPKTSALWFRQKRFWLVCYALIIIIANTDNSVYYVPSKHIVTDLIFTTL